MPKGKHETCGGLWNTSGTCATGLNCLKFCKRYPCKDKYWYSNMEGHCVNKDEAPVSVAGLFHVEENFSESTKPVQKCPETFKGWNTAWNTEYPQD